MRDYDDIPEPFRRALEEVGWGDGNDGPPKEPSPSPRQGRPWWTNRGVWLTVVILAILLSFNFVITTYTDWLWFNTLNYEAAWLRQWGYRAGSFVIFFAIAGTILIVSWTAARRRTLRSGANPQMLRIPGLGWLINGVALFMAFVFAQAAVIQWDSFLRYFYRVSFGEVDPIFNRDISFYLFELPVFRFLQGWFLFLVVIAVIGTALIYAVGNARVSSTGRVDIDRAIAGMRPHLSLLLAAGAVLWAAGYWLDTFELLYSPRGVVFGASYADLNAQLPALRVQMVLMLVLALAIGLNAFRFNWRLPAIAGGLWLAATILGAGVYPSLLQRYSVEPNELEREAPFIGHNIAFTRLAFGLDEIDKQPFAIGADLTATDLANEVSLTNVRVWDYRPLQQTYSQLQGLRPYYQFNEVDIDRYEIDGQTRQVMLAVRELDKARLPSRTWVNEKLIFTHGYGVVMSPVDRITRDGQPEFFIQDLPPRTNVDIEVSRPEIYYGELDDSVVFVNSNQGEFSYPSGERNVTTSYEGSGGILISNTLRRLAFTIRFAESNLILSNDITPETRVMLYRTIRERVEKIAPFLYYDDDPYIVIVDGRLVWMMDAYTISTSFPYSEPAAGGINYIRNAVKVTIDAYDGNVNFYIADRGDPIIRAYDRAFPGLFQDLADMPEALQRHIRFPEGLFVIQTQQYLTYHMTDPEVFYNQEDLWQIPQEKLSSGGGQDQLVMMEPYYVILTLPGGEAPEYLLIQPYSPSGKDNMISWIAARNDPPNYGELVVYELPKQELVFGPSQIEARIDQDTVISQQISLWNQQGSEVIRGNLIVIPIANNFLYVEPLYLQAESSALPELKRVIVATGNRIAMQENLPDALAALLLDDAAVLPVEQTPVDTGTAAGGDEGIVLPETVDQLINSANAHFEAAQDAQRRGDWATYGTELAGLQSDLQRLVELTGTP